MKLPPEEHDPQLDTFSKWLKQSAIQPSPDFLSKTRHRLLREADPLDQLLDQLFEMDTSMKNPEMPRLVRQRLENRAASQGKPSPAWFTWLAPLAAAATLTLAFLSFQARAPQSTPDLAVQQEPIPSVEGTSADDIELTQIFALAANLHSSADMSHLQSVEDLASLFD